jgi:UPF0716 protein FxsA
MLVMRTVGKIFLILTIVSAVELYLLIKLAGWTSWSVTIATVLVPGLLGSWLLKREGSRVLRQIGQAFGGGQEPSAVIVDGVLIVLAGAFLITPGVLTDVVALALLVPPVRARIRGLAGAKLRSMIERRMADGSLFVARPGASPFAGGPYEVIDAEDIPKQPR